MQPAIEVRALEKSYGSTNRRNDSHRLVRVHKVLDTVELSGAQTAQTAQAAVTLSQKSHPTPPPAKEH